MYFILLVGKKGLKEFWWVFNATANSYHKLNTPIILFSIESSRLFGESYINRFAYLAEWVWYLR